jgi:hypothetical protein
MSKPYIPANTMRRFYRPPTLKSDFDEFLDGDLPNQVMDFELIPDWYDRDPNNPIIIRGELYPDSTKSRYENTDNNMNIRCSLDSGIKKGDIVIASNNKQVYVLDWETAPETNNIPSRALRCNMLMTVIRWTEEQTDDMGYLVEEEGWTTICEEMPANAYRYDGRPEYSAIYATPGISPNALTLLTVQLNHQTADIHVDDRFVWGNEQYTIIDVNYVGVGLDGFGTLKIQARKTAGGEQ